MQMHLRDKRKWSAKSCAGSPPRSLRPASPPPLPKGGIIVGEIVVGEIMVNDVGR